MIKNDEIIEIWINSIIKKNISKKIDIEKGFKYLNPFFLIISFVLISIFILQIYNWLFLLWEEIDINNFTYKYSNYKYWWNIFWIFTSIFLHWGIDHIIWNLLFFYIFSLVIYRLFNFRKSFILFIFLWLIAGIPWYFLNNIPSIWASWAIFWIFWVSTIFYFLNKNKLESNLLDISWVLLFLAGYQVFSWFTNPLVDNLAHISWYLWWLIIWYCLLKNKDILNNDL
jgi:membrane associated rhomboid family serine protease